MINDILIEDKIGSFPKVGCHEPAKVKGTDSFLTAYRKIYKKDPPSGGGKGGAGQGFDTILDPGTADGQDPMQAEQERSQVEWDTAVASALAAAKLTGKLPAGVARLLDRVVNPTVSWQDHIRAFFARKIGEGAYDFRKPDRRLVTRDIVAPSKRGNGCEAVVVAVDTSGSIGNKELAFFFAEMSGILEDVRPRTLYVIWCDSKVHKIDEVEDAQDVNALKPLGGGNTDFRPVFDKIEELGLTPDALVYLTDGYGSFPDKAPDYPVVWGDISGRTKYPWGDTVHIDMKG